MEQMKGIRDVHTLDSFILFMEGRNEEGRPIREMSSDIIWMSRLECVFMKMRVKAKDDAGASLAASVLCERRRVP